MKIILIEPTASEGNIYSKAAMPLLGPVYLGTILKNRGHEVEIYNEDIHKTDYSKLGADIIGISILTSTAKRGYEIARQFPKEKVIIGGVHASLLPDEALPFCRQVVVGEADNVIVDVVEGRRTEPIVYGTPVEDLDTLPNPDFTLVKGFWPSFLTMPISTSRGCPFDCSFCSVTKIFGRKYRFRSPENIIEEMKSRRTRSFFFVDDNFTADPKRTKLLLELLLKNKMDHWNCQVRCDAAKDKELLRLMANAGCKSVFVGFESINPMTLQAYQKRQTLDDIVSAIRSFHRRKIKIHGMFVLGGEDDGRNAIWETLKFTIKHKIDTIQMAILTPFPGTKVYESLDAQNRIFTKDWSLYDGQHVVFNPKLLSARDLQMNALYAYMKFYSLPRAFSSLLQLHFRNAMFRFIGHYTIKEWVKYNCNMAWLAQSGPRCGQPREKSVKCTY